MRVPIPGERRAETAGVKPAVSPLTVVAASLGVALIFFLLVMIRDSFGLRTRIAALFSDDAADGASDGAGQGGIPSMTKEPAGVERIYFEINNENALDNLFPVGFYTRELKVVYSWDERESEKNWTLVSEGDCWRLSDAPDEIFCDGERIYSYVAGFASVGEGTDWEPEIGAATLDGIRARLSDPDTGVTVTSGERTVQIRTETPDLMREYYEIDVESGLILSESCRYDTKTVRTISTESLTVSEDYPVREEYEERARAFYEAHPELIGDDTEPTEDAHEREHQQ